MKASFIQSLVLLVLSSASLIGMVETGSQAPNFSLVDTKGETHSLSDYEGKYVVLEWTNHQCPFVVKHYSSNSMQSLQKEMTESGVVWLQVVSSAEGKQGYVSPEEGEALRASKEMHSTAMLLDPTGEVGHTYDARTSPHMYLISPEGKLLYQGAIDSIRSTRASDIEKATNYVEVAYASAIAGEPITEATTVPYGCSIKY